MEIFWDIAFHAIEILTLLFGVLGMAFSLLLLFSPRLTKSLGSFFNRNITVGQSARILDKDIPTEAIIYSHHVIVGLCLVAGSVFALIFFFFNVDIANFASVFLGSPKYFLTLEIIFFFLPGLHESDAFLAWHSVFFCWLRPRKCERLKTG